VKCTWKNRYVRVLVAAVMLSGPVSAAAQDMLGTWSTRYGSGALSASIRRGRSNPAYFVVSFEVAKVGCQGDVTVYGKLGGTRVVAETYQPSDPSAPVCKIELELVGSNKLRVNEGENCYFFHGTSCGYEGTLTRR